MKDHYDFSKGKRGAVLPLPPGKERITIRLDTDILNYFRDQVDEAGGGNYQTAINAVLREFLEDKKAAPQADEILRLLREFLESKKPAPQIEEIRRVIREELRKKAS